MIVPKNGIRIFFPLNFILIKFVKINEIIRSKANTPVSIQVFTNSEKTGWLNTVFKAIFKENMIFRPMTINVKLFRIFILLYL